MAVWPTKLGWLELGLVDHGPGFGSPFVGLSICRSDAYDCINLHSLHVISGRMPDIDTCIVGLFVNVHREANEVTIDILAKEQVDEESMIIC